MLTSTSPYPSISYYPPTPTIYRQKSTSPGRRPSVCHRRCCNSHRQKPVSPGHRQPLVLYWGGRRERGARAPVKRTEKFHDIETVSDTSSTGIGETALSHVGIFFRFNMSTAYHVNQIKLPSWKTVYDDYENKHNCVIDGYAFPSSFWHRHQHLAVTCVKQWRKHWIW